MHVCHACLWEVPAQGEKIAYGRQFCRTLFSRISQMSLHLQKFNCKYLVSNIVYLSNLRIQWSSSIPDTLGPERTVLTSEVSSFQGLKMCCIKACLSCSTFSLIRPSFEA